MDILVVDSLPIRIPSPSFLQSFLLHNIIYSKFFGNIPAGLITGIRCLIRLFLPEALHVPVD